MFQVLMGLKSFLKKLERLANLKWTFASIMSRIGWTLIVHDMARTSGADGISALQTVARHSAVIFMKIFMELE